MLRQTASLATVVAVTFVLFSAASNQATARDLTAGFVASEMETGHRFAYLSGVVEGLAYARFVADGRQESPGMACIYGWFYGDENAAATILAAFERFPDHLPGAVIGALVQRRCGP